MGRDAADIDWDDVKIRMECGSSGAEIAAVIGIHSETFYRRFKQKYKVGFDGMARSGKEAGYSNLRKAQYESALKHNTRMMDKLGDVWLGQGKQAETNGDIERLVIGLMQDVRDLKQRLQDLGFTVHEGRIVRSELSSESPLSYQGCSGSEDQVSDELGARNSMEGETQL